MKKVGASKEDGRYGRTDGRAPRVPCVVYISTLKLFTTRSAIVGLAWKGTPGTACTTTRGCMEPTRNATPILFIFFFLCVFHSILLQPPPPLQISPDFA